MNAEELAKLFHTAYENNFSKHVKTVQKEVLSWEDMTPDEFVAFWCQSHGVPTPDAAWRLGLDRPLCRRIEWRYIKQDAHREAPDA